MADDRMAAKDDLSTMRPERSRNEIALNVYLIGLSALMMVLGLRQWAVILGVVNGAPGPFEQMSTAWKIATMHLSVVDLVASVGLWMRVAWGKVVWILAVVSEILFHTVFVATFGSDLLIVSLHLLTLAGFAVLSILVRRR